MAKGPGARLVPPATLLRKYGIQTLSDSNEACTKLNFGGDIHNTKHIINTIGKIYVNTAVRKTLTRFGQTVQKLPSTDVTRCPD